MGYVKPDAYDIFMSYASVNNDRAVPGRGGEKWVDVLTNEIRVRIDERLGEKGVCRPFTASGLAGNIEREKEIIQALDGAAVLLLVLSTGYLNSEWCLKEVVRFEEVIQRRRNAGSPVFVIEYEPINDRPAFLKNVTGYQFWTQNPLNVKPPHYTMGYRRSDEAQDAFENLIEVLVHELAGELQRLRKAVASEPTARVPRDGAVAVAAPAGVTVATARDVAVVTAVEVAGPPSEDAATVASAGLPPAAASPAPLAPDPPPGDGKPTKEELRTVISIVTWIEWNSQRRNLPFSVAKNSGFRPDRITACFDRLLELIDGSDD